MSKLSIIIPVYNVENYLRTCLDSVYCQEGDYDIILVDDGSNDSSSKICDEYEKKYPDITSVIHQENMGLGGARNSGLNISKSEYVFFLDSDDTITSNAISKILEVCNNQNPDIILFDINNVDEAGNVTPGESRQFENEVPYLTEENKQIFIGSPSACDKVFKRQLFTDTGVLFPSRVWYEDIRTTPKLLAASKNFIYIKEPLYNYLRRQGSIMNNQNIERNHEIVDALEDLISYLKDNNLYDKYREEIDYLVLDHVYVSATVRILRTESKKHHLVSEFLEFTDKNVKSRYENAYFPIMPKNRKIVLDLLNKKMYFAVTFIFRYIKK